jgi:hypothetical protein
MKFLNDIKVYGDQAFRGECPSESMEQVTFFNRLRRLHPDPWGAIAIHPRNEGIRTNYQVMKEKSEGMTTGASDVIIPGNPAFVCEIKRKDHTKSKWQNGQLEYLNAAKKAGAFACIALGADAAWGAFQEYLQQAERSDS